MRRIDHVWVASKDGDQRRYASAEPFSAHFAESLRRNGFRIRRVDYEVDDVADVAASALAVPE